MTKVYESKIDYLKDINAAEDYIGTGREIPNGLLQRILSAREDYKENVIQVVRR